MISKNLKSWKNHQPVRGTYYDHEFTGILLDGNDGLIKCRFGPGNTFIYVIKLDQPIQLYGETREIIEIWSSDEQNYLEKI